MRGLSDDHRDLYEREVIHDVENHQLPLQDVLVHELRQDVELHEYYGEVAHVDGEAIHDGLKYERARNISDLYVKLVLGEHSHVMYGVHHVNHDDSIVFDDDIHAFHVGLTSRGDALLHVVPQLGGNDV